MRRLTRFSMRTLLVLVTLQCVGLGWYVANRDQRQQEVAAVEALKVLMEDGGRIAELEEGEYLECGWGLSGVATVRLKGPEWLTRPLNSHDLRPFHRVVKISLTYLVDDRAIPHLAKLSSLETIYVRKGRFTDEGEALLRSTFPDAAITIEPEPELDPDSPVDFG